MEEGARIIDREATRQNGYATLPLYSLSTQTNDLPKVARVCLCRSVQSKSESRLTARHWSTRAQVQVGGMGSVVHGGFTLTLSPCNHSPFVRLCTFVAGMGSDPNARRGDRRARRGDNAPCQPLFSTRPRRPPTHRDVICGGPVSLVTFCVPLPSLLSWQRRALCWPDADPRLD